MSRHDTTPTDDDRTWARSLLERRTDLYSPDVAREVRMARALGVAESALKAATARDEIEARSIARARAITEALWEDQ